MRLCQTGGWTHQSVALFSDILATVGPFMSHIFPALKLQKGAVYESNLSEKVLCQYKLDAASFLSLLLNLLNQLFAVTQDLPLLVHIYRSSFFLFFFHDPVLDHDS